MNKVSSNRAQTYCLVMWLWVSLWLVCQHNARYITPTHFTGPSREPFFSAAMKLQSCMLTIIFSVYIARSLSNTKIGQMIFYCILRSNKFMRVFYNLHLHNHLTMTLKKKNDILLQTSLWSQSWEIIQVLTKAHNRACPIPLHKTFLDLIQESYWQFKCIKPSS